MHLIALLGLTVLLAVGITTAMRLVLGHSRTCPACEGALDVIAPSTPAHTYEVLECPKCLVAVTLAGGRRDRFAWCPRCKQRALALSSRHLGNGRVAVHEACSLCTHEAERDFTRPPPPPSSRGLVLPFRRPQ